MTGSGSAVGHRFAYRGNWVVGICFISTALSVGTGQYAFGLFIEPLEATFGWTRTEISASLSFAAISSLAAPFIGRAMDKFGARPVLAASLSLMSLSFLLRPLMSELWHWYALSFMQFVAFAGASNLPTGKMVGVWFARTRGRVMGLAAIGNNFGGLVVPPLVAALLIHAAWQEAYVTLGVCGLVIVVLALCFMREGPEVGVPDEAVRAGNGADNDETEPATDATGPEITTASSIPPIVAGMTAREALRSRLFYALFATITLGYFTYSIILPHALAHFTHHGMSLALASITLSSLAVGGIVGKLAFGAAAERRGARPVLIVNLLGQAVFAVALSTFTGSSALRLLAPLMGFFLGGFGVLATVLVQDIYGMRHFGAIMGLITTGGVLSFGLGPIIAGASFDWSGGYDAAFITAAGLFSLAALVLGLTRIPANAAPSATG